MTSRARQYGPREAAVQSRCRNLRFRVRPGHACYVGVPVVTPELGRSMAGSPPTTGPRWPVQRHATELQYGSFPQDPRHHQARHHRGSRPGHCLPPVTFDLNDPTLRAMLAQAVAVALAAQKAELMQTMAATKPATNGKSDRSLKNEIAVVKAFKKAGFGDVRPHEDVRTFNRWVAA